VVGNRVERVSFGMVVWGKGHLIEGNEVCRLVWGSGVNDCDYFRFFGEGHIFRRNYLHGTKEEETGPAHVDGFQTFSENPGQYAQDIAIEGNLLAASYSQNGVMMEGKANWRGLPFSVRNITVCNNVFAGMITGVVATGVRDLRICNNTFIIAGNAGIMLTNNIQGMPSNAVVANNIFCNGRPYSVLPTGVEGRTPSVFIAERNVLFNCPKKVAATEKELSIVDPLLRDVTDIVGGDGKPFSTDDGYLLRWGSPCIDAGGRVDDVHAYDILGTSRPQGPAWDIGAYEFPAGGPG